MVFLSIEEHWLKASGRTPGHGFKPRIGSTLSSIRLLPRPKVRTLCLRRSCLLPTNQLRSKLTFQGDRVTIAKPIHILISVILFAISNARAGQPPKCADLAENIEKVSVRIHAEDFGSGRSFQEYLDVFKTTDLIVDLTALNSEQTWLDMGCGEDATALREFAASGHFKGKGIGVTVKAPKSKIERLIKKTGGRIRVFSGSFIEDLKVEVLPKARVITDLFGPFSYSTRPDLVLQKYLDLLEVGGSLHLYFIPFMNEIEGNNGNILKHDFGPWFKLIEGVSLQLNLHERTAKLLKTSEKTRVPQLELVRVFDFPPPLRFFRYRSEEPSVPSKDY